MGFLEPSFMKQEEIAKNAKESDVFRKGCVVTNLAYVLMDVANSMIVDADSYMKEYRTMVNRQDKKDAGDALQALKRAKMLTNKIISAVNDCEMHEQLWDDSEEFYKLLILLVDRDAMKGTMAYLQHRKSKLKLFYNGK